MPPSETMSPFDTPRKNNSFISHTTPRPQRKTTRSGSIDWDQTGSTSTSSGHGTGEDQPLEWHEVIELQAFSERKAWIEEKIKFLEQLPPIQVFVGLDAVRTSAPDVPGLPTREELAQWLAEHDKIEKETEIFDSGELKKLKKFTKAAAQRNLSPADTDLIELTLTTIYALDKLLHLLRDRSDNLELLSVRMTWEERRRTAWAELHSIVADLRTFLAGRARWSPTVYEQSEQEAEDPPLPSTDQSAPAVPSLRRRGSMASLASMASDSTASSALALSRGDRFKLAEVLSRDAAQFASRVSSLRHTKISAAGKALDKLIDDSRKPVPEELLDEQDRLEDKGINDMEDIGKFVMGVVMQWKKADEIYAETVKDKASAQTLLEEIETAKFYHPSSRQDTVFLSRSMALMKRLDMRGNPASSSSFFPRPYHHLFPDQESASEVIVRLLANELSEAYEHARETELAAKEYHSAFESVRKAEAACRAASDLIEQLTSLSARLESGVDGSADDGSPPDLSTEVCLGQQKHSVFLALFPSLLDDLQQAEGEAIKAIRTGRAALADLPRTGIDPEFALNSAAVIERLATMLATATSVRDTVSGRVATLKRVRSLWSSMADVYDKIGGLHENISELMRSQMWKQQAQQDNALLTPESPSSPLPPPQFSESDATEQLERLDVQLQDNIIIPLDDLDILVGQPLRSYLSDCASGLSSMLKDVKGLARIWALIRKQAAEMSGIRDETQALQMRSEDLVFQIDNCIQDILDNTVPASGSAVENQVTSDAEQLKEDVLSFQAALTARVPFVAMDNRSPILPPSTLTRRHVFVSNGFNRDVVQQAVQGATPFDGASLDRAVRADCNSYSMLVAGEVEILTRRSSLLRMAHAARALDESTKSLLDDLHAIGDTLESYQAEVDGLERDISMERLATLSELVDKTYEENGHRVASRCISVRDELERLEAALVGYDPLKTSLMTTPRRQAVEDAEEKFNAWRESVEVLSEHISDLRHQEQQRLLEVARLKEEQERARLAEEAKAEQERVEAEAKAAREAEEANRLRARAEQERLEAAEREREEAERLDVQSREAHDDSNNLGEETKPANPCLLLPSPIITEKVSQAAITSDVEVSQEKGQAAPHHEPDVFDVTIVDETNTVLTQDVVDLQNRVFSLRKRLKSLHLRDLTRPVNLDPSSLPSSASIISLQSQFEAILKGVEKLPSDGPPIVDTELRSLRAEISAASEVMNRIRVLASLSDTTQQCDNALSDLLEHIDSYPAPPTGQLSSSHVSDTSQPPEQQMKARLNFTQHLVEEMQSRCSSLDDDSRATSERNRIVQTWEELQAMGKDCLTGNKSRPGSVLGSGRSSRASITPAPVTTDRRTENRRSSAYSRLSVASPGDKFLAPPPNARRSTSGSSFGGHSRSSSRTSLTSSRSVSGPINVQQASSTLYQSTFASRQRSTSISASMSSVASPSKPGTPTPAASTRPTGTRPRARTGQSTMERVGSPLVTETPRSQSRSSMHMSRSSISTSRSTWSRAPRQSFPNIPKSPPPRKPKPAEKKPYVPNPTNKLDVAVGDVVNNLPVNINIEVVADTWKDQSGKYWIGDDDPKLCFCRILRSQTVMVRVGGGWTELSKFIREHFADAFRLLPESPPRAARVTEEKWISSATLAQVMSSQQPGTPPLPPRTPEPKVAFVPSFALSTPSGASPRSIKSSSPGSPLHPIQFIRRADRASPALRPDTPTRAPRASSTLPHTQRLPVWRP